MIFIEKLEVFPKTHDIFVVFRKGDYNEIGGSAWFTYTNGELNLFSHTNVDPTIFPEVTPTEFAELRRQILTKMAQAYLESEKVVRKILEKKFIAPLDSHLPSDTMYEQENDDGD